jgi:hypothetical protein
MAPPTEHQLLCVCGHWVYDHGSHTDPAGGRSYHGCRKADECGCEQFRNYRGQIYASGELSRVVEATT